MAETENDADVTALTVELLSAYLANNTISSDDLPRLIRETRLALTEDTAPEPVVVEQQAFTPAVSIRKSQASSAHLLSLIDGKPYKTLKRHLAANGLTPATYRERYKLPADYPMVAPDFAAKRRAIAEQIGLGNRPKPAAAAATPSPIGEPVGEGKTPVPETPALRSPAARDTVPKSPTPAAKARRKVARKPVDAPVVDAPGGDKVSSAETIVSKAKPESRKAAVQPELESA